MEGRAHRANAASTEAALPFLLVQFKYKKYYIHIRWIEDQIYIQKKIHREKNVATRECHLHFL